MDRLDPFLAASTRLTGFGRVDLLGTGVAEAYLTTVCGVAGEALVADLCAAVAAVPTEGDVDTALSQAVLADERLGPVAQRMVILWYTGTWSALPDAWHAAHGDPGRLDETHTVSGDSYISGFQWKVIGAHPPGAAMQGFGAWSLPPQGVSP